MNKAFLYVKRDYLESHISQEEMFLKYFGHYSLKDHYTNPLRKDSNAGCRFMRKGNDLLFIDNAWCEDSPKRGIFSAMSYASRFLNKKGFDLYYQIALDFNLFDLSTERIPFVKEPYIEQEKKLELFEFKVIPFTKEAFEFWSLPDYTATKQDLNAYRIQQVKDVVYKGKRFKEQLTFAYLLDENIYQMYFPTEDYRPNRFRSNRMGGVHGIDKGLVTPRILTKSYKDYFFMSLSGFNVRCVLSENYTIKEHFDYVLFDNDETGIKRSNMIKELFGTKVLLIDYEDCKDYTDLCKKIGLKKATEYLNNLISN